MLRMMLSEVWTWWHLRWLTLGEIDNIIVLLKEVWKKERWFMSSHYQKW